MDTLSVLGKAACRNIYGKVDNVGPEREEILAEVANKSYIYCLDYRLLHSTVVENLVA